MEELEELGKWLLQLKEQTKSQKKMIDGFKTEKEHLTRQIRELNMLVQGIISTYGERGEKILALVNAENEAMKSEVGKQMEALMSNISQFDNRLSVFESQLKTLESDTKRLASERKKVLKEIEILDKIKNELSELEKWKHKVFERLENQDARINERLQELVGVEKRTDQVLSIFSEKIEKAFKDLKSGFEEETDEINSRLEELEDEQRRLSQRMRDQINDLFTKKILPRLAEMGTAVKQVASMRAKFYHLSKKAEEQYARVSAFKRNFEKSEKDMKVAINENLRRIEKFETRMTDFINDLVDEYEKRFDAISKELKIKPHISPEMEEPGGFLSRVRKVLLGRKDRIFELECKVKEQQKLLINMLKELRDLTQTESEYGDENARKGKKV